MTIPDDVHLLTRRLDALTRAATNIRRHLPDLHVLAYEAGRTDSEPDRGNFESRPPPGWKPGHELDETNLKPNRSCLLWSSISLRVAQVEAVLVGLERQLTAHFYAGGSSPEPTRGVLIRRDEFDEQLANQRRRRAAGQYTPTPLIDQPDQPGAR